MVGLVIIFGVFVLICTAIGALCGFPLVGLGVGLAVWVVSSVVAYVRV